MKKSLLFITICLSAMACGKNHQVTDVLFGNINSENSIMSDYGIVQYPKNASVISGAAAGTRVYYICGMDVRDTSSIDLFGIQAVRVKECIPTSSITEETDTLGHNIVYVREFALYSGGYLNLGFDFSYVPYSSYMEIINLEYDDVVDHGDTLVFSLHHKRYLKNTNEEDTSDSKYETSPYFASGIMSFPINKLMEAKIEEGLKTVPVKVYGIDRYGRKTYIHGNVKAETFVQKPLQNK